MTATPRGCSRTSRWWALALALPLLGACEAPRLGTGAKIARIDAALGASQASSARYLRYRVASDAGVWTREIVVSPGAYAERRTRSDGEAKYAFGHDQAGAWLRVRDGEPIDATGSMWEQEARTGAGLYGLGFAHPAGDDEADFMGRTRRAWELAFRPAGGRTMTLAIDRATSEPSAYDVVDDFGRLVSCDGLDWSHGAAGPVLAQWRCAANDRFGFAGKVLEEHFDLEAEHALGAEGPPDWATIGPRRASPPPLTRPVALPIVDARSIRVPVTIDGQTPVELILDTGAFFTILTARAAARLGVVPTGEIRLHVDPPWLARTHLWVGVVEKLSLAGAELYGERVLVAESLELGGAAGLLGVSSLQRFIVDVDSPARALRFASRSTWKPERGERLLRMHGDGMRMIDGQVKGVAKGLLQLDTGAADDIIVHAFEMSVVHRRQPGSGRQLGVGDSLQSPDYASTIDGLGFGPFSLPKMDALGRDRDRDRVGGGIALVGMGVMRYFRLAFDFHDNLLHAWPGDGYRTLRRAGMDVEEGAEGPTVDRVIEGGPAEAAGVKRGDVILAVNRDFGVNRDLAAARRAIGRSRDLSLSLWVMRNGAARELQLGLAT